MLINKDNCNKDGRLNPVRSSSLLAEDKYDNQIKVTTCERLFVVTQQKVGSVGPLYSQDVHLQGDDPNTHRYSV
jgi:hypothetical protein